eukprot:TRINITY_DN32319_c0_g1_i1.p1 TRINITY_DN32319_c0_g1~~TRINITY_DN32319_c0_g1_i1.p1  ORF type:complete len:1775 (+),score=628.16 TRINITY_DN32319_c0_g1_i1:139-5463(+)
MATSLQKYVEENVDASVLQGSAFFVFSSDNTWRQLAYLVTNNDYFVTAIYVLIVFNALTMALVTPLDDPDAWQTKAVEYADLAVLTIFTIEMLLKMLAQGAFFGSKSYWQHSGWNKLDLVVIVGSFIGVFIGQRGFSAFRAFRAFRIFRAMRFFTQLNNVLTSLRSSLQLVVDNSYFMGFFFILFGVLSVDLFQSSLRRWCVVEELYAQGLAAEPLRRQACKLEEDDPGVVRANCPVGMICVRFDNDRYNHGYSHMDDIFHAFLVIWQISTLSSWTEHLYYLQQSEGELAPLLYCALMIFVLNFIVINLFVAVVGEVFGRVPDDREDDEHHSLFYVATDVKAVNAETRRKRVTQTIAWALVRQDIAQECVSWGQQETAEAHERREEDTSGGWELTRMRLIVMVRSRVFILLSGAVSVANSAIMANHGGANQTETDRRMLLLFDRLFFALLAAEVLLRFLTTGRSQLSRFLAEPWDAYDLFIVVASAVSMLLYGRSVSFMRFRILQLTYYFEGTKSAANLLNRAVDSIPGAASIVVFILLCFYIFGVAGVQFFAGKMIDMDTGERTRLHFDHFASSQLLLFRVMSGDTWEYYLRVAWHNSGLVGVVFILVFFLWAVFVLLNLFTAVVLESFSLSDEERMHDQLRLEGAWEEEQRFEHRNETLWVRIKKQVAKWMALPHDMLMVQHADLFERSLAEELQRILRQGQRETLTQLRADVSVFETQMREFESLDTLAQRKVDHLPALGSDLEWNLRIDMEAARNGVIECMESKGVLSRKLRDELNEQSRVITGEQAYNTTFPAQHLVNEVAPVAELASIKSLVSNYSLFVFHKDGCVRRRLKQVVESKVYESFMVVVIVLSTVALALEYPREATWWLEAENEDSDLYRLLRVLDWVWLGIFGLDVLLNVIADGFFEIPWGQKRAYLNDGWKLLDFMLLIGMLLTVFFGSQFKSIQALRTLRPVRVLRRVESIFIIVAAIWRSLGAMVTLCIGYCYLFLVLGIWSLIMYAGKFSYCNDGTRLGEADCVGEYVTADGLMHPRAWLTHLQNFDTISGGMLTLVEVTSLASWTVPMYNAMDITGKGLQPEFMATPMNCLFFIFAVILCSFYLANIFVAIIIDSINRQRGISTMTRAQRAWVNYQTTVRLYDSLTNSGAPSSKSTSVRLFFHQLVNHRYFERAILVVVIVNIAFMASTTASQPDYWDDFIYIVDVVCLFIYILELVAKVIAFGGVRMYLRSVWNRFDAFVVVGTCLGLILERVAPQNGLAAVGAVRMLRVARIFRLMTHASGMKYLFKTLILSLPAIFNITLLLLVMMLIYAVFGKSMFGNLRNAAHINNDANFRSTAGAMGHMFRVLTLDNWHYLLRDAMGEGAVCTQVGGDEWIDDCGSSRVALAFYLSFYVFGVYIFINLILAVILDNFGHIFSVDGYCLSEKDIVTLDLEWLKIDTQCAGDLPRYQVRQMLERLFDLNCKLGVKACGAHGSISRRRHDFVMFMLNQCSKELTSRGKVRPAPQRVEDNLGLIFVKWRDVVHICVLTYVRFHHPESLKIRQRAAWKQEQRAVEQAIAVQRIGAWVTGNRVAKETAQRLGWQFCLLKQIRAFLEWKKQCTRAEALKQRRPPPPFQRYAEIREEMLMKMEKESMLKTIGNKRKDACGGRGSVGRELQRERDNMALSRAGDYARQRAEENNEELLQVNRHKKAGDYAGVVDVKKRRRSMLVRDFDLQDRKTSLFVTDNPPAADPPAPTTPTRSTGSARRRSRSLRRSRAPSSASRASARAEQPEP